MASLAGGFLPVAAQPYGIANPDARTLGMGGIETVTSADAYAVFNNPAAGLFGRQKAQVATSFFTLSDKTTYSAAGYYKFNMQHLLAGGWRTFGFDERLKDKSVSLAYAYRLNDIVALGLTADYARFVRERSGNAFSAGITAQAVVPFEQGENYSALRLGAKLTGIGGFLDGPIRGGCRLRFVSERCPCADLRWRVPLYFFTCCGARRGGRHRHGVQPDAVAAIPRGVSWRRVAAVLPRLFFAGRRRAVHAPLFRRGIYRGQEGFAHAQCLFVYDRVGFLRSSSNPSQASSSRSSTSSNPSCPS